MRKIVYKHLFYTPLLNSFLSCFMLFVCAAFVNQSQAQQKDEIQAESDAFVYEGNAVLDENFTEAEKYYRRAISKKATNAKSSYNLGSAYYAAEFYDEALSKLIESTEHGNKKEKHAAFHNIGNTLMKNKKCKEAVEAYKSALRNNPADDETRYNLALAKDCAEEQGGGGDEGDDDKEKEDKDEQNKDQKEDSDKQQDKDEPNKNKDDKNKDPKEKGGDQKDNKDKPKDKKGDQKNPNQNNKNRQGKMSPQQVKNLLEAMNNEEKKVQEKMNASKVKGVKVKTDKDW